MEPVQLVNLPSQEKESSGVASQLKRQLKGTDQHRFGTFEDLKKIIQLNQKMGAAVIGKKPGLKGWRLLKPLNQLTYDELIDLLVCGCGRVYDSLSGLRGHIKKVHMNDPPPNTLSSYEEKEEFYYRHRGKQDYGKMRSNPLNFKFKRQLSLKRDLFDPADSLLFQRFGEDIAGECVEQRLSYPRFLRQLREMGPDPQGELTSRMSIDRTVALFLCNLCPHVKESFLLWIEDELVSILMFTNKNLEKLIGNYERTTGVYTDCTEFMVNQQKPQPMNGDHSERQFVILSEYTATHTCQFFPLVAESYLVQIAAKKHTGRKFQLIKATIEELCRWLFHNQLTHIQLHNYSPENFGLMCLADLSR